MSLHETYDHGISRIGNSLNTVSGFNTEIKEVNNRIHSLISVSERDFLKIGNKLQQYLTKTREISRQASKASTHLSEDILKNGITELTWLLKQFREKLNDKER